MVSGGCLLCVNVEFFLKFRVWYFCNSQAFIASALSYFHSELPLIGSIGCVMCSNSEFLRVPNVIHDGNIVGSAAAFNRRPSQATISMRVDEEGKIYCGFKVA